MSILIEPKNAIVDALYASDFVPILVIFLLLTACGYALIEYIHVQIGTPKATLVWGTFGDVAIAGVGLLWPTLWIMLASNFKGGVVTLRGVFTAACFVSCVNVALATACLALIATLRYVHGGISVLEFVYLMPSLGWFIVKPAAVAFTPFTPFTLWAAFVLFAQGMAY